MAKTIELDFQGYWQDKNRGGVSDKSGIYLVYTCTVGKKDGETWLTLKKLVYIGEADNIKDRIGDKHEKRPCWKGELKSGEVLCFSYALKGEIDRKRAEAALIFKKKPECNEEYKNSFPFEKTTVKSSGRCAYIPEEVIVEKTL